MSVHVDRSQPTSRSWHKAWLCCCVPQAVPMPLNEFCHSTGTGNFAKVKRNQPVTISLSTGIDPAWHDKLDTMPAPCRTAFCWNTNLVVTNKKVFITFNQADRTRETTLWLCGLFQQSHYESAFLKDFQLRPVIKRHHRDRQADTITSPTGIIHQNQHSILSKAWK